MLYPINTIIAIDQATGARVENGSGYVYAVSDTARVTPLSIFDLSGLPLTSNLLETNSEALIPPFQVEGEWQVVFVSGDSEIILTSWLGLKEEAAASADAANEVATKANNGEFKGNPGNSAYEVWLDAGNVGTVADYLADIEGPPGKDGSNVLPTDEAIEQAVTTDGTATNAALKATFATNESVSTAVASDLEAKIRLDALAQGKRLHAITAGNRSVTAKGVTVGTLVNAATASTIAGAARVYAYDRANTRVNPNLRILGTRAVQANINYPRYDYIRPDPTIVTYAPGVLTGTPLTVDTQYGGAAIDLIIRRGGGIAPHVIYVDGLEAAVITEDDLTAAGVSGGQLARLPLVFDDARPRVITYYQGTASSEFPGYDIDPTYSLAYPAASLKGPRVLISGDSFTEGVGAGTSPGYTQWVSWHMGWGDVWRGGSGGTGYQQDGGRLALVDRYQNDIIAQDPDIVVIAMGINDNAQWNQDPAPVLAAAKTVWDGVIAGLPAAEIVIVGPFWPGDVQPTDVIDDMDAQFRSEAEGRGLRYISPVTEQWITGTGNVTAPAGDGNADQYISADGTHPSAAGHEYIGWRIAGHLGVPHVPA